MFFSFIIESFINSSVKQDQDSTHIYLNSEPRSSKNLPRQRNRGGLRFVFSYHTIIFHTLLLTIKKSLVNGSIVNVNVSCHCSKDARQVCWQKKAILSKVVCKGESLKEFYTACICARAIQYKLCVSRTGLPNAAAEATRSTHLNKFTINYVFTTYYLLIVRF